MNKKKYKIFVAFDFENKEGQGKSNAIITCNYKIDSIETVKRAQEELKSFHNSNTIVITNFIYL